jgi:hypothetical protein
MTKRLLPTSIDEMIEELIKLYEEQNEYKFVAKIELYRNYKTGNFKIAVYRDLVSTPPNQKEIEALAAIGQAIIDAHKHNQGGHHDKDREQGESER